MKTAQWMAMTAAVLACTTVHAQNAASTDAVPTKVAVSIEAQPIRGALQAFGKQTGIQVLFRSENVSVDGLTTPRVVGELSAREALDRLLRNTGLKYEFVNEHTVRISSASPVSGVKGPDQLVTPSTTSDPGPVEETKSGSKSFSDADKTKLEEIVVTAQKRPERLQDVPISISVLSGKDLDNSSFQGATEALNTVPGVTATPTYQGGGTQVVIRGVGASGPLANGSSPVAYYLDSAPFSLVKTAIVPDPNVYDLQRIEVLRGPQGTLYGANAENGVVRVLTNDANLDDFDLKGRLRGSTTDGGGGNYGGDLAVNVPLITGKLAARAVVDYDNSSGWIDSPVATHINDSQLRNYRLKVNAAPMDDVSVGLNVWSARDNYGAPPGSDDQRRVSATLPQFITTDYDVYGVKLGYTGSAFSATSMSSYLDYSNRGDFDLTPYALPPGLSAYQGIFAHSFSEEINLNSASSSAWRWTAGAFYRDATDRLFDKFNFLPTPVDISYSSRSYAAFGEAGTRFLNDRLEWTLGLRYFHDDVVVNENVQSFGLSGVPLIHVPASFNSTTPRGVLRWYPSHDLTLYASYSQGFRSGFPQDPVVVESAPSIPAVKPDKLHNYEFGGKGSFLDNRLVVDTAVYYIDWRDIQQQLLVPYHGIYYTALVNAPSASGTGVDLSLAARPIQGLELGLTFGWNNLAFDKNVYSSGVPLFTKGDRPSYSSEYTGGGSIAYKLPLGSSGLSGAFSTSANYSSRQLLHGSTGGVTFISSGDTLLLVRTGLSVISSKWTAAVFVDNLNNSYAGSAPLTFPLPELRTRPRPRTIGMQFDYRM